MLTIFRGLIACSLFTLCGLLAATDLYGQKAQQIVVRNTASISLKDKPIAIKRSSLGKMPEGIFYPIIFTKNNDTIPAQADDLDGDGKWDELFFVADLLPNSTTTVSLKWTKTKPTFLPRTSVRFGKRSAATLPVQSATSETVLQRDLPKSIGFQRYQTDGPSWENDKVGFRHYLDGRNAKDVFGKLLPAISPENVGINAKGAVEDNYHVMEKWGRDILAVGNAIGIGGVALVDDQQPLRLGVTVDDSVNNVDKTTFNIVTEGPVRSVLHFDYDGWKPATGKNYTVDETVSIWPGMYAYHNSVKIGGLTGSENMGIGLVNINSTKDLTEIKVDDNWVALVSHDKHAYNKEWWIGLALIVPANAYNGYVKTPRTGKLSNTFLVKLKIKNNEPVQYFSVAAWEMSDKGFADGAYFEKYVKDLANQISAKVNVVVK